MIGTVVSHYKILDKLGEGGMGVVYRAEDITLHREVALKFLPPTFGLDSGELERFTREAQILSSLNHPNISTIYALDEHEGQRFIVMELIEGQTLKERIASSTCTYQESLGWAVQAAEGLAYAHKKGIIHRDIKSENIMVTAEGRVKITDFGIAKLPARKGLTNKGTVVGTAAYMSPEQASGEEIDIRSDIFSFGVVLYELFSGKMPFTAPHEAALVYEIVYTAPEPLQVITSHFPAVLIQIIEHCMEKERDRRYQTMEDLVTDLSSFARGEQTSALSIPLFKTNKGLKLILLAAGLVVVCLILVRLVLFPTREEKKDTPSLAILFLKNLGDKNDDPLTYGIVQDLIVDIAKAGIVRVAPMKDILALQNTMLSVDQIAHQLRVHYIMDGTFKREGDQLKITAQIIEANSGKTLWADRILTEEKDLSGIQAKLVDTVIACMGLNPTDAVKKVITQPRTLNPDAYEYYLRANYVQQTKKSQADVEVAKGLFEKSISYDSLFSKARIGLGLSYEMLGQYDQATEIYNRALDIATLERDSVEIATSLVRLGVVRWNVGANKQAQQYYLQSLAIFRQLGDRAGESTTLTNIGVICIDRAEDESAISYFDQSLAIIRELGDKREESRILNNFGAAYQDEGNYSKAFDAYSSSLVLRRELEDKRGEADVLTNIGNLYSELGSFDEAEKLLNQSLTIHKELGNRQFESQAYENLGELYTHMGKYPQAIDYFNQCLKTSREIHFYLNEGFAGEALGILYIDQKMYSAAIDTLRQTAAVFSSHGYTLQMLESQALGLLATVSSGNKQNYLTSFTTIRSSYDSLAGGKNDIRFITTLYRICAEAGDTALTSRYLFQAHDLLLKRAETINKPALKESYLKNIPENVALLQAWDEKQK